MEIELSNVQKENIEAIMNWMLPGVTLYYRDADLDINVEEIYQVGKILRTGFFIDMTSKAQKPCHNVRYIIASAHAACIYQTEMCNPFMKDCNLCVLHPNSFLKVLDIYKVGNQTQILLLHIPMNGIEFMQNLGTFNFVIEDKNYDDYFIQMARKSFDDKIKMEPREILETEEWLDRTKDPIGLRADNTLFGLEYESNDRIIELEIGLRKLGDDTQAINMPIFE